MRQSKLTDEQIVALLREAEKGEKSITQLARENQVTEQTSTGGGGSSGGARSRTCGG